MTPSSSTPSVAGARNSARAATPLSLRYALTILFRDRRRILLAFLIPFALTIVVAMAVKPKYEATASLLVRFGREYVFRNEAADGASQQVLVDPQKAMPSELEILTSRSVAERAIGELGVARLYPEITSVGWLPWRRTSELTPIERAVTRVQKDYAALLVRDATFVSNVIQVSFKHTDRQIAADTLNRLVAAYLHKRQEVLTDQRTGFVQQQVDTLKVRLTGIESKIAVFKREAGIASFDDQRRLLLGQQSALADKVRGTKASLGEVGGKLDVLNQQLSRSDARAVIFSETVRDDAIDGAKKAVFDLRQQERAALAKYAEDSITVRDIRSQIAQAEASVQDLESRRAKTARTGQTPVREAAEVDTSRLRGDRGALSALGEILSRQLADVTRQLEQLSQREIELTGLVREKELTEQAYASAMKRLQDARITDAFSEQGRTNVTLIQPALPPLTKKNVPMLVLVAGLVLSVVCALVVAFLSDLLRDTYLSPDELGRSLGLPVLATFPDTPRTSLAGTGIKLVRRLSRGTKDRPR